MQTYPEMETMNYRIQTYVDLVRSGKISVCEEQLKLCDLVERTFKTEDITLNEEQLEKYLTYQKYFPFPLLDWEIFCFALHNCVYKRDGQLRWPILVIYVGRGAGKNGYLGFEDFCLLTPTNGVKNYNIDIFAMSEKQAMQSFKDVYNVLEDNKSKMEKHFSWNKELIKNKKTGSELAYNTSSPKTKDGARPGKVDFDEYHAYESSKLVDVATTGLGKVPHPRRTIITTDGDVRDGPLDTLLEKCQMILNGEIHDNGTLPFLCRIKDKEEIKEKANWPKANPSLPFFKTLQHELEMEYTDYLIDPIGNSSFATKRMNCPQGNKDVEVTSWDNIVATKQDIPELKGNYCTAGIDYASTTDFVATGMLFISNGKHYWISHQWVCEECKDLSRIKYPLREAEERGLLTFVKGVEIPPEIPAQWLAEKKATYNILKIGIDKYRYTLLSKALREYGFDSDKKGINNIILTRPGDEMMIQPTITSLFNNHQIAWGDNSLMRWNVNNSKIITSSAGNITYGKIEPKSRKTDGFKAFIAAEIAANQTGLEKYGKTTNKFNLNAWSY